MQGFRRLLHPKLGKYAANSQQKRDITRAAQVILRVLKPGMPWAQLRHAHYRQVLPHQAVAEA